MNNNIFGICSLAPMAGITDRAFREICMSYGASYCFSELVSAKGVAMNDNKSRELLKITENERPMGLQLFGDDPYIVAEAAVKAMAFSPNSIDLNIGCPAPKVANNGGGSGLLKNPILIGKIASAVVNAVDVPVTAKIRIGWDEEHINAVETAHVLEDSGIYAVTVHGRTRSQMYSGKASLDAIAEVKSSVNIPVIGNGDIIDGQSAAIMLSKTGCDGVMIGRGAMGRPWVFAQVNAYLNETRYIPEPPVSERMRVMLMHVQKVCEYKGEYIGMREARTHAACYIKGIKGAAAFRNEIGKLESMDQLAELAYRVVCSVKK